VGFSLKRFSLSNEISSLKRNFHPYRDLFGMWEHSLLTKKTPHTEKRSFEGEKFLSREKISFERENFF
jgi:hypothetical protein